MPEAILTQREVSMSQQGAASTSEHESTAIRASANLVIRNDAASSYGLLPDEVRESAIKRAGKAVERHMEANKAALRAYEASSCWGDKGKADRHYLMAQEAERLMAELIRGRRVRKAEGSAA